MVGYYCHPRSSPKDHGIVAYTLTNGEVRVVTQPPSPKKGDTRAGECLARVLRSPGMVRLPTSLSRMQPFVAHQYECTLAGDKGRSDIHERHEAYADFARMVGVQDEAMFREYVDAPLLVYFGSPDVQGAVLYLAKRLYEKNKVLNQAIDSLGEDAGHSRLCSH